MKCTLKFLKNFQRIFKCHVAMYSPRKNELTSSKNEMKLSSNQNKIYEHIFRMVASIAIFLA